MTDKTCFEKCGFIGEKDSNHTRENVWSHCSICKCSFSALFNYCPCCGDELCVMVRGKND